MKIILSDYKWGILEKSGYTMVQFADEVKYQAKDYVDDVLSIMEEEVVLGKHR